MLYKYPRTFHFPWSEGTDVSDKVHDNVDFFNGKEVVATIKMDGENTTMYRDAIHARSLDSRDHPSRSYVKQIHGEIKFMIPEGVRICGENLYAEHSIRYDHLLSYFYVFSVWENYIAYSWDETEKFAADCALHIVPTIYRGVFDKDKISEAYEEYKKHSRDEVEGYVVRLTDRFSVQNFNQSIAKYVRKNHVQTDQHWMYKPVVKNGLL